ncbi:MAG TPA: RNA polymerase sigma factor, partial [Candidatus Nanopelagicales bacterium]|nr:RNA polymerase sigma factor [Candidatus Nanopelagicales bacterium]
MVEGGGSVRYDSTSSSDIESRTRELLGRGDRKGALTVLMKGYGDDIYGFCQNVVRCKELAKDLLQTTFMQAYDVLGQIERLSYRAWLFSIAHNRCLDALKSEGRRMRLIEPRDKLPDVPEEILSSEERLIAASQVGHLAECLGELDAEVRIAIILRYQEGYTYPEISRICHERPATLQARVTRA